MHKIVVLYNPPADPAHFKNYYETSHLPLVAKMPNLLASRHSFAIEGMGGPAPFFAIWEGDFADEASANAGLSSEIGQAVAADVGNYASGGITIFRYTTVEA